LTKSSEPVGTTLFIGGGSIGAAMIAGLRLGKYAAPIAVHDHRAERMRLLRRAHGATEEPDLGAGVRAAQLIVLAVRPDAAEEMLQELDIALRRGGRQEPRKILVSVMAGLPLAWLQKRIRAGVRWARAMPSPLCESGNGLTALAFGSGCVKETREAVHRLFGTFGQVVVLPERHFDAFTVIYSPSHGVHALSALADAGVEAGLSRKTALQAAAHGLSGAEAALRTGSGDLKRMERQAATPGGTAEATMAGMESAGYRRAVARGVQRGIARARTIGSAK
jgi:pyrroline-5-carboxylate reductase